MQTKTLADVKGYLQSIKSLFINGQIRLVSEDWIIKITYKDSFQNFTVKEKIKWDWAEVLNHIADFCFSIYFDFERDWRSVNSEIMAKLLNISHGNMRIILHRLIKKLRNHGESILGEEEKAEDVQDHWQESEWDLIPKKQGTKFPWSEEERFEVPLWEN